jgi:hypothetical protein
LVTVFVLVGALGVGMELGEPVMVLAGCTAESWSGRCLRMRPVRGCDRWWCGVVGDGVAGVEPGLFESGLDAGFDLVGDVAIYLDGTFVEAAGLSDLGDAGGDEPGFVAVA